MCDSNLQHKVHLFRSLKKLVVQEQDGPRTHCSQSGPKRDACEHGLVLVDHRRPLERSPHNSHRGPRTLGTSSTSSDANTFALHSVGSTHVFKRVVANFCHNVACFDVGSRARCRTSRKPANCSTTPTIQNWSMLARACSANSSSASPFVPLCA